MGTTVADSNGDWSFSTTRLTNGTFDITAQATDQAGNTSVSATSNVIAGTRLINSLNGTDANNVLVGYAGNDTITGLGGDDLLVGGGGNDTLTGGLGNDQFAYQAISDRGTTGDIIADFNTSEDKLVLTELFRSLGYSGSNPIADGYLRYSQVGADTQVQIDQDGLTGGSNFNTLVTLNNVDTVGLVLDTNVII